MSHISEDILRRYIDEPDALLSYEKEHLLSCNACRAKLGLVRENADHAAAALAASAPVDIDAAYARVTAGGAAADSRAVSFNEPRRARFTSWMGALAAVIAVFLLVAYTPLRGYAGGFLAIFEPHQFTPIGLSTADISSMEGLPDLGAFGTMHESRENGRQVRDFSDPVSAAAYAHQQIFRPRYLPQGVPLQGRYFVSQTHTLSFTFSESKVRATAAKTGKRLADMPDNVNGSTLSATLGPIVVQWYATKSALQMHNRFHRGSTRSKRDFFANMPNNIIVVTQAPAPRVYSTGATVVQIEAYLLAQPQLPPNLVRQIRAIGDPSTTVPVPFPLDKTNAQNVSVNGANALLIGDNTGVGSVVIWQRNGMVYGVAGPYAASQIVQVANSLAQ